MKGGFVPTRGNLAILAVIVLLGAGFRLLWIRAPLLDAHRWRQVDTAAIARSFYEDRFNVFYPQVNWGGQDGFVESEFPLLPAIVAGLYKVLGPQDYIGRVVSMTFSTATIVVLFLLTGELIGASAGLAAAFLLAVSPAAVFFGRTFMPDSTMLFFWVAGLLGFVRYFRSNNRRALWLGSLAMALACLVKIPALMMMAPVVGAAWQARGRAMVRDRAFLTAALIPVVLTVGWYVHAYMLYRQTGLTFGILAHPARTYPLSVAPGPWTFAFAKWGTLDLLTSWGYWLTLLSRLYFLFLLPWGLAGALLGAVVWKRNEGRVVADLWLAAALAFLVVMAGANSGHDYYQLPLVPLGAIYFGAFAGPVFDLTWQKSTRAPFVRPALLSLALVAIGIVGFYFSGIVNSHFRPGTLDLRVLQAAEAVIEVVPSDALVVVADDYGSTSPLLLYFTHKKGWSFDVENLFPQVIEGLNRRGARYFVSTVWSRIVRERPDVAAYLALHRRVALQRPAPDTVVFELGKASETPAAEVTSQSGIPPSGT